MAKTAAAYPRWLMRAIALLIGLGIALRFYHLDAKVFWADETMTALRISGQTTALITTDIYTGVPVPVQTILDTYQFPTPDRGWPEVLTALQGNPEHAPLYYLLARLWIDTWGHSTAVLRSLSVLFSLLSLPCMYWLAWELFQSPAIAGVATALIALSPFHLLYAQEAREYSLWITSLLLASAVLLRAQRLGRAQWWGWYAGTVALSLYTHPFSALVLVSHGLYLALSPGSYRHPTLRPYGVAAVVGLALFGPWMQVMWANFADLQTNTAFLASDREGWLPLFWGLNLSRLFFDVNQGTSPLNPALYLIVALVGYAAYDLYWRSPRPVWLFLLTFVGVTGTALIGSDLLLGGHRSSITRYAIPCYLGLQLMVAHLLGTRLQREYPQSRRWRSMAALLVVSLLGSCLVSSQFPVWWHKSQNKSGQNPEIAAIINASDQAGDRPVIISDVPPHWLLPLTHLLQPEVRWQLVLAPQLPTPPADSRTLFLYRPSDVLRQGLEAQGWQLRDRHDGWLWIGQPPIP